MLNKMKFLSLIILFILQKVIEGSKIIRLFAYHKNSSLNTLLNINSKLIYMN